MPLTPIFDINVGDCCWLLRASYSLLAMTQKRNFLPRGELSLHYYYDVVNDIARTIGSVGILSDAQKHIFALANHPHTRIIKMYFKII